MIHAVLSRFEIPGDWYSTSLGNANGFSGCSIWKIEAAAANYCLKRWPSSFRDNQRIAWIHKVLVFAAANDCPEIIVPLPSKAGPSFIEMDGYFWELSHWATGEADYIQDPNPEKLESAIESLARFHQATARYHLNFADSKNAKAILLQLLDFEKSVAAIDANICFDGQVCSQLDWERFKKNGPKLAAGLASYLKPGLQKQLPVQPVIRDLRCEHLFFENDRVCSIIDFGAMQIDTISCDLSRMLGSMLADDNEKINEQIDRYSAMRPISDAERDLISPFNTAGVLLGILNWLTWIFVDKRYFESTSAVRSRLQVLFARFHNYV